jgi:hypothetical protein
MRTSGENEILPKNLGADVRSQDRMYRPKYHRGHTTQNVTGDFIFTKPSHNSYFSYSKVVLVIELIESFPQIWRTQIVWNSRKHYSTQVNFNLHMLDVTFHALHANFMCQENMQIYNSHSLYLLHMNSNILRKCCAEYINKVRLVKRTYM